MPSPVRARRSYGMHTDASLRFERGVDPTGQGRAVDRATQLLLEISGGEAGPLVVTTSDPHVPQSREVGLRRDRVARILGVTLKDDVIIDILSPLGTRSGWNG